MSANWLIRYSGVFLWVWVTALMFPHNGNSADEGTWVTVEAEVPMTERRDDARRLALARARQLAITKAVGADLTFKELYVNTRLGGSMDHAIPHGDIVKSEVLTERAAIMTGSGASTAGGSYKVQFKAAVRKTEGGKNPAFRVFASLNQGAFADGDEMQLRIQATADCYLMAFVLMEDERVLKLLPNALGHDTFLPAGRRLDFPSTEDVQRGIRLLAHLTDATTLIHEAIYILALKRPLGELTGDIKEGIFTLYDGRTAKMQALVSQVVAIPPDQRAEAMVYYQIRPKTDS